MITMMLPEIPAIAPPSWRPIEDLPSDWERLHTDQLRSLGDVWRRERAAQLEDTDILREFNERLSRQWAIETGIIEGLYTIDRGTTQVLIEHGIVERNIPHDVTSRPKTLVAMLRDHEMVLEGAFDFVQQRRTLSTSYIKEIHAALTRHQPTTEAIDSLGRIATVELLRGEWKKNANNPTRPDGLVHPYCPPEHVPAEMDRLVAMHLQHMDAGVAPEVEAAWLHHRFTQIHPFQDGNGRVARVLASLVFLRAGWFPLIIDRDQRGKYIDALELADRGMLTNLVHLFAKAQEHQFFNAFVQLDWTAPLVKGSPAAGEAQEADFSNNTYMAPYLDSRLPMLLGDIAFDTLTSESAIWNANATVSDFVEQEAIIIERSTHNTNLGYGFAPMTKSIASRLGYVANSTIFAQSVRLLIASEINWRVFVSFHGFGRRFVGILAVSSAILGEDVMDTQAFGSPMPIGPDPLINKVFLFAQDESQESATARFREWISDVWTAASKRLQQSF